MDTMYTKRYSTSRVGIKETISDLDGGKIGKERILGIRFQSPIPASVMQKIGVTLPRNGIPFKETNIKNKDAHLMNCQESHIDPLILGGSLREVK